MDEQAYAKMKMLQGMEDLKRKREAIQDKARIDRSIYADVPDNVVDMPKKKLSTSKKLETLSGINQALENPDMKATQKLQLRDHAINLLKEEGYSDDQLKHAKGRMKAKIDRGNFKKFGAIPSEGKIGDSIKKAGKFAGKVGKKGLKALPLVGPIATAMMTGDVSAAIDPTMSDDMGGHAMEGMQGDARPVGEVRDEVFAPGGEHDKMQQEWLRQAKIDKLKSLRGDK